MVIHNPKQTLENRYKIEQKLIEKYSASSEDLAVYFGTTPSVIRSDLRNLNIEAGKGNESEIEYLRTERDKQISEQVNNAKNVNIVLVDYGLWRESKNLKDVRLFKVLKDKLQCLPDKREKIIFLMELGWSLEDVIKRVGGLGNADRHLLSAYIHKTNLSPKYVKENDIEMNEIVKETLREEYQKSIEKGESYRSFRNGIFKIILNLTGASETKMYEAIGKKNYAEKRRKVLKDRKKETAENNRNKEIEVEILKNVIYKAWTSKALTKEEIAETIGVTRQTIYNWISEMDFRYQLKSSKHVDYVDGDILIENNKRINWLPGKDATRLIKLEKLLEQKRLIKESPEKEFAIEEIENRKIV